MVFISFSSNQLGNILITRQGGEGITRNDSASRLVYKRGLLELLFKAHTHHICTRGEPVSCIVKTTSIP